MDTKSDEQFLIIESTIEANKQEAEHINAHLRHISPLFIPQVSKFPKGVTIWIPSLMNSS